MDRRRSSNFPRPTSSATPDQPSNPINNHARSHSEQTIPQNYSGQRIGAIGSTSGQDRATSGLLRPHLPQSAGHIPGRPSWISTDRPQVDGTLSNGEEHLMLRRRRDPSGHFPSHSSSSFRSLQTMPTAVERKRRLTAEEGGQERRSVLGRPFSPAGEPPSRPNHSILSSSLTPGGAQRHVSSRSVPALIDLTSSSPLGPADPSPNTRSDSREAGGGSSDSDIVLPSWQDDAEAPECQVCETPFSFWYRKHHCRKCGRVVCSNCSPHRITLPRQYIVQPPTPTGEVSANPIDLTGDSPARLNRRSNMFINPALGGGEEVRVCNPCVPDPNLSPPPQPLHNDHLQYWRDSRGSIPGLNTFAPRISSRGESNTNPNAGSQAAIQPQSPGHFPFPSFAPPGGPNTNMNHTHAGAATTADMFLYNAARMYPNAPQGQNLSTPSQQPFPNSAIYSPPPYRPFPTGPHPTTASSLHSTPQPQHQADSSTDHQQGVFEALHIRNLLYGPNPDGQLQDNRIREFHRQHADRMRQWRQSHDTHAPPPPPPKRVVAEEDECPVCGEELPPKSPDGGEAQRERHIEECIQGHFVPGSGGGPSSAPAATTGGTAGPAAQDGGATMGEASTPTPRPRRVTGARGMLVWKASEKDCFDEEGEEQECIICFEEFVPGAELGRLECWCKFHASCIREWWVAKGAGTCPTHQLQE
ncbi:FYVE-domain-containing protein [Eremomyces bilateralis CBS 781.70]|uniref:RING-type E3 ubiquitin transferase n=1 Tax=Eremomyces bilateralis CBS 781.70 TaxID=1392243 RepID=A0A6G1GE70_9PEZI|nr:FYVE-domain-containing protein [Eremomyces bilateralis CBS 781.70]KAF1816180.1 FYVE-domain-containing protein [Eremomyces bilateralis CBS 781.70]